MARKKEIQGKELKDDKEKLQREIGAKGPAEEGIRTSPSAPTFSSPEEKQAYEDVFVTGKGIMRYDTCITKDVLSGHRGYSHCESLINHAIGHDFRGKFLEEAVKAMVECRERSEYGVWSHSVCHLFEKDSISGNILCVGRLDLAERLIEASVDGAVENGSLGCTDRTLGGVLSYNLSKVRKEDLDKPIPLMFKSMERPEFIELLESMTDYSEETGKRLAALIRAKTQRDLVPLLLGCPHFISQDETSDTLCMRMPTLMGMLDDLIDVAGTRKVNKFFGEVTVNFGLKKLTSQQVKRNLEASRKEGLEQVDGVYVDVEGTLIGWDGLNESVVKELRRLKAEGKTIRVFTGGDPVEQEKAVKDAIEKSGKKGIDTGGLFEFPVLSKEGFKGKLIEVVIDDSLPEMQGFKAKTHVNPRDLPR